MSQRKTATAAFVLTPLLLMGGCSGALLILGGSQLASATSCSAGGSSVQVSIDGVPAGSVAGYSGEQLANAAAIINAGAALGLSVRGQTIGVMTAMGESSLKVLDRGDAVGPDSRGLFQQRANGAWGSYSDRMDPTISATNFFRALTRMANWETLSPTEAAHRTQRNADPYHYARYWDAAVQVVTALSGNVSIEGLNSGAGENPCAAGGSFTAVSDGGWAKPSDGPITSRFGRRRAPTAGASTMHKGIDLAPGCEKPIWAAAAGVVIHSGTGSGFGHYIAIDHGGGVVTRYGHMYAGGLLVKTGDKVTAGQQIARIGSDGTSTGCHNHFEVVVGGAAVDPVPWLAQRGITF
ncbi:M23 family metallopeptidase [Kineococcus sp. SYSU DK006]|uniref:M23 family metallopeptidase n=1 Tax=Kineococcus sp. SYSU DK006 TaxID=3383127 RepID=UPI003D7E2F4E